MLACLNWKGGKSIKLLRAAGQGHTLGNPVSEDEEREEKSYVDNFRRYGWVVRRASKHALIEFQVLQRSSNLIWLGFLRMLIFCLFSLSQLCFFHTSRIISIRSACAFRSNFGTSRSAVGRMLPTFAVDADKQTLRLQGSAAIT